MEDVVDALILMAINKHLPVGPFNLGNSEKIRLSDLANKMIQIYGRGEVLIMEYPQERKKIDIGDYYSCHKKFTAATGWKPKISLDETLSRTINYYKKHAEKYL